MIRDGLQKVLQGCVSSLTGQTRLAEFSLEGVEGKFRTVVLAWKNTLSDYLANF